MGFIRKILGGGQPGADPGPQLVVDPFLGDPLAREWAARIGRGDDEAFRAYVATEPDLDRRDFTIDTILDSGQGRLEWVDRWVADEPDSALANMVLGRHLTGWAWEARSNARAKDVKAEQFDEFFSRLDLAWKAFERAVELDPEEASTYALMIDCAKGLQAGIDTVTDLYDAAQERRPWQPIAHSAMIQALAKKWSGSAETMLDFARHVTDTAPEGSVVHVVIPDAHVEVFLDEGEAYLRRPEVLSEIIRAAERSVDSPMLADSPMRPRLHNSFGYCYWIAREHERARREFERAGPFVTGPFRFSNSPLKLAATARRQVGAPARG